MLGRLLLALAIGLCAAAATSGVSQAALSPDATAVALGTFGVAAGLMVFLLLAYLVKRTLGLVKQPPPEDSTAGGHH